MRKPEIREEVVRLAAKWWSRPGARVFWGQTVWTHHSLKNTLPLGWSGSQLGPWMWANQ